MPRLSYLTFRKSQKCAGMSLLKYFYLQYNVKPLFADTEVKSLEGKNRLAIAYDGSSYLPGVLGLNNIKANDYCNAVFQVRNLA